MAAQAIEVCSLSGHSDRVWHVAWSHAGTLLGSCGGDKSIRFWRLAPDAAGGRWQSAGSALSEAHMRTVRSLAWAPSDRLLAAASFDATVSVWRKPCDGDAVDDADWQLVATLEGHENEVKSAAWSADGQLLATCSRDKSVWLWELDDDDDFQCVDVLQAHSQDVKCVTWHPTGPLLASSSYDDSVRLFRQELGDWTNHATLTGHSSTVWCVAFDPTGCKLASVSDDCTTRIWQSDQADPCKAEWRCAAVLSGDHERAVTSCAWSCDSHLLATASSDNSVCVYRDRGQSAAGAETLLPRFTLLLRLRDAHSEDVNCVAFHPQQPLLLATAGDDGFVKLWQLQL